MGATIRLSSALAGLYLLLTALPATAPAARTAWLVDDSHAGRIARAERLAPIEIEGEPAIDMTLARWMDLFKVPGLSVAVFDDDRLVWAKSYGVREAGGREPVEIDTLFQAASISKPVTALAVLHHARARRWSLDENINERLRSWKLPDNEHTTREKVTLRRLLSHSAGTTVHGFPGYAAGVPRPSVVQILDGVSPANTAPVRVDVVPGSRTRYSGGGTTIVQQMLVDQLEKPFPEIMKDTVLDPIGMADSSFEQPLPPVLAARAASATHADGRTVEGRFHVYPEMAAAGLWTTPSDLAKLAIEVSSAKAGTSSRVLSREAAAEMLTRQSEAFGIGFALGRDPDWFGHNGANAGFQAYLKAFAGPGRGIAIMANSDNGVMLFERLAASIAAEYGWQGLQSPGVPSFVKLYVLAKVRGADRAAAWYRSWRQQRPAGTGPGDLNRLGYQLLRAGDTAGAVTVFRANVEIHPDNANAYDSLAEGYMIAGDPQSAIANYRKSLEMDPANTNAVRMLEKLGAPGARGAKPSGAPRSRPPASALQK